MRKFTSLFLTAAMCATMVPVSVNAVESATSTISFTYGNTTYERRMEKLDRGLVAVKTSNGVYVGWRLTGEESTVNEVKRAPKFEVYRNGEKIAVAEDSTNYLDTSGNISDTYSVAIVGEEPCEAVAVKDNSYFDIPMDIPEDFSDGETTYTYSVGDASTGDLDGDGQYELVVKWDCNAKDNSHSGITGNVYLDAYELTGEKMWRIDLGRNIRSGAHYTQFLVYDFDLDGIAEITAKTAPGSIDGTGAYVTEASSDEGIRNADNSAVYVNDSGYVLDGDEYFTAFDGRTGAAVDTIYYPNQRISASTWGDAYGNRCDRFIADVAYLDGEHPYAVYWRGYYGPQSGYRTRTGIFGVRLDENKKLQCDYCFDTYDTSEEEDYKGVPGYTEGIEMYHGQGNHNMTVADVDNDGKDEFLSGSLCFEVNEEDKLAVKWCSFRGHGDALHIGDYDPTHYGLEYFSVHEGGGYTDGTTGKELDYGMTVYDAATGEELYHRGNTKDTGRGAMANIGAGGYYQISGSANMKAMGNGVFEESSTGPGSNFRIFWNADLYDDILDGVNVSAWDGSRVSNIFTADGCVQVNGTKANPALQADLFGDWREELCYPLSDNTAIRVFTTTDVTEYKLPTLMHDPVYRSGVAAEQTAYNQPPHVGFYLSEELYQRALVDLTITPPTKTEYAIGDALDTTGMAVSAGYDDGSVEEIHNYSVSGFDSLRAGEQEIIVGYKGMTKSFTVKVATGFSCDENGYITGYTGANTTETIPEIIDNVAVKGIGEGALENTTIENIYIYNNVEDIKSNSFTNMVIYCYEGSAAHMYAADNAIDFVTLVFDNRDYLADISFEEEAFEGMSQLQTNEGQSSSREGVTFVTGARGSGGDGETGFEAVTEENGNVYMRFATGRFATSNRHAYITIDKVPQLGENDTVVSFDFMFPTLTNAEGEMIAAYMTVEDENGLVDTFSKGNLGVEFDAWYNYMLVYTNGEYIRIITDATGGIVSMTSLGETESANGISKMQIYRDEAYGSIGNHYGAHISVDNFKVYNVETALSNVSINVVGESGAAVSGAEVTIGSVSKKTDASGTVTFTLPCGAYNVAVSAADYHDNSAVAYAYTEAVTKRVVMASTAAATATPTAEPTATPTAEPTATPTAEPTATPTAEPTATPTVEPTATPTVEPTATPTVEPTATPTVEPTATPTVEPTATPEPTMVPEIAVKITAEYDADGRLTGINIEDIMVTGEEVFIPAEGQKIFIWRSLEGMMPWKKAMFK